MQATFKTICPDGDLLFVPRVFGWGIECFTGKYKDYQPIDARYHDLEHTLQGTLCMMRLLQGRHFAGAQPAMTQRVFQLGLLAILFHDTGYLKKKGDDQGTGAKYTATHVMRSAEFAAEFLGEKGFSATDIRAVQNMIQCTGVNTVVSAIPFQNELEKITGYALATSDLLGQMAADDYVEKLPILFEEFVEAAAFVGAENNYFATFKSAQDLMKKTPAFWEKFVLPKLNGDFGGLYRFLGEPYPDGPNEYVERIEANMEKLRRSIAGQTK